MSAALAENKRDVIREHPIAGLSSARARGRKGGRPAKLTPKQVCTARKMLAHPEMTIKEVAEAFGVNQATNLSLGLQLRYAEGAQDTLRDENPVLNPLCRSQQNRPILLQNEPFASAPRDPGIGLWYYRFGLVHLLQSRISEVVFWLKKERNAGPRLPPWHAKLRHS